MQKDTQQQINWLIVQFLIVTKLIHIMMESLVYNVLNLSIYLMLIKENVLHAIMIKYMYKMHIYVNQEEK